VVLRQVLGRERLVAALGRSASLPASQAEQARSLALRFDVPLVEIDTHELDDPRYLANPIDRCFFCKAELWTRLAALAADRGLAIVCDGTNADDLGEHRPGFAAGVRAGVRSPLADAGLTKARVRDAARLLGLPNWDAPAAPCLSSRVRYGLRITPARLQQIEEAETILRDLGVRGDVRVRHHGERARIEVTPEWIPWVAARLDVVRDRLRALGFERVELDPDGYRRGALLPERRAAP
jgi:uncharacterized protein